MKRQETVILRREDEIRNLTLAKIDVDELITNQVAQLEGLVGNISAVREQRTVQEKFENK